MYNIVQRLSRHERHDDGELRDGGQEAENLREGGVVQRLQDAALRQHRLHLLLLAHVSKT